MRYSGENNRDGNKMSGGYGQRPRPNQYEVLQSEVGVNVDCFQSSRRRGGNDAARNAGIAMEMDQEVNLYYVECPQEGASQESEPEDPLMCKQIAYDDAVPKESDLILEPKT